MPIEVIVDRVQVLRVRARSHASTKTEPKQIECHRRCIILQSQGCPQRQNMLSPLPTRDWRACGGNKDHGAAPEPCSNIVPDVWLHPQTPHIYVFGAPVTVGSTRQKLEQINYHLHLTIEERSHLLLPSYSPLGSAGRPYIGCAE